MLNYEKHVIASGDTYTEVTVEGVERESNAINSYYPVTTCGYYAYIIPCICKKCHKIPVKVVNNLCPTCMHYEKKKLDKWHSSPRKARGRFKRRKQ